MMMAWMLWIDDDDDDDDDDSSFDSSYVKPFVLHCVADIYYTF